jgi:GrpB-like predicted nucleotidyltransferase (UPF0157 family)
MVILLPHSDDWEILYNKEASQLRELFGSYLLDIQHIGSTSIEDLLSKPIIDIAVQIASYKDTDQFITPLEKFGYIYRPQMSSSERHFFQKGDPIQFHLSIAYLDRGEYWKRQILFRDYLRNHKDARREYEVIKENMTSKYEFVQRILVLADSK